MKRRNASQILKSNTVISKNTKLLLWAGECKNQSNKEQGRINYSVWERNEKYDIRK